MGQLDGKVALVTGSGRGIGQALVLKLASEGARIVVNDLDPDPANQTVELLRSKGAEAVACVVNISSGAGTNGNAGQANYSSAKAGVIGLTKALSKEWGRLKVNVNCVAFGLITTRLTEADANSGATIDIEGRKLRVGMNPELLKTFGQRCPLGRPGTPEEAAAAVYNFCSPLSDYVSGEVLRVGGGA